MSEILFPALGQTVLEVLRASMLPTKMSRAQPPTSATNAHEDPFFFLASIAASPNELNFVTHSVFWCFGAEPQDIAPTFPMTEAVLDLCLRRTRIVSLKFKGRVKDVRYFKIQLKTSH